MALIELEASQTLFSNLVQLVASMAPVPTPTLAALGAERLLHAIQWGFPFFAAGGPSPAPRTLTLKAPATVSHLSIAELQANPNATPTKTAVDFWVQVSVSGAVLSLHLVRADVAGQPTQVFSPPLPLGHQDLELDEQAPIVAGAVLVADEIVTLRFASKASDSLDHTPVNLLAARQQDGATWLVHAHGALLAELVKTTLSDNLGGILDDKIKLEESPHASWEEVDGHWGVSAGLGLLLVDACPSLFGEVDMSVALGMRVDMSVDLPDLELDLVLHVSHDTSDWDTFRCWLGAFGPLLVTFTALNPFVGLAAAGLTLTAMAGAVDIIGHQQLAAQAGNLSLPDFAPIVTVPGDDATYAGTMALPSLPASTTLGARVDVHGVSVWGSVVIVAADHQRAMTKSIQPEWMGGYDCGKHAWAPSLDLPPIAVTDKAKLLGIAPIAQLVTVFPARAVTSGWKLKSLGGSQPLTVASFAVTPTGAAPGQGGSVILHTSAGLHRTEILPIPAAPDKPATLELAVLEADCFVATKHWPSGFFDLRWLIDPPPDTRLVNVRELPALRQWLVALEQLPTGATLALQALSGGRPARGPRVTATASHAASVFLELCTAASEDVRVTYRGQGAVRARVVQRWLLPEHAHALEATPQMMIRASATEVALLVGDEVRVYRVDVGLVARHRADGARGLVRGERGLLTWGPAGVQQIVGRRRTMLSSRPVVDGELLTPTVRARLTAAPLASVALAGRVLVVHGAQLVVAEPYGLHAPARR